MAFFVPHRTPFVDKPKIPYSADFSNDLIKGLQSLFLPCGNQNNIDYVSGKLVQRRDTNDTLYNYYPEHAGELSVLGHTSSSSSYDDFAIPWVGGVTEATIFFRTYIVDTINSRTLFSLADSSQNSLFYCRLNNVETIQVYLKNPYYSTKTYTNAISLPLNQWVTIAIAFRGQNIDIYFNGEKQTFTYGSQTDPGTLNIRYFMPLQSGSYNGEGYYSNSIFFDRFLEEDLTKEITNNPYQLLYSDELYSLSNAGNDPAVMGGDASSQSTSNADLTTEIPIAAASLVVSTGNGSITTGIQAQGLAASITTSNASMDSGIPLDGDASGQSSGSADLITGGTGFEASASVKADSNADLTIAIQFSGDSFNSALMAAGLDTETLLFGDASGSANANADLSTGNTFAGQASGQADMQAGLTAKVQFTSAALVKALANAGLTTQSSGFEGQANGQANALGVMDTQIPIAGNFSGTVTGQGDLSKPINFIGSMLNVSTMDGTITINLPLSGEAAGLVNSGAILSASIEVSADAFVQALAQATLTDVPPPEVLSSIRIRANLTLKPAISARIGLNS